MECALLLPDWPTGCEQRQMTRRGNNNSDDDDVTVKIRKSTRVTCTRPAAAASPATRLAGDVTGPATRQALTDIVGFGEFS